MKKLFLLVAVLLLVSCQKPSGDTNNPQSSDYSNSEVESETESHSQTETEDDNNTSTSSDSDFDDDSENEDVIPSTNQQLPIGNKTVSGPDNLYNPIDISEWANFDLFDSLPEYFSYIQGNNKVYNGGDFYASSSGGGFKFSKLYYGFQTPVFTTWKKLEIRIHISQVNNNSQKKDEDEPIFHIYGYNSKGEYIAVEYLDQGSITKSSENQEIKLYIRNENICYLEFRLNAYPYKGNQCYNFGVDELSLKGWQWE